MTKWVDQRERRRRDPASAALVLCATILVGLSVYWIVDGVRHRDADTVISVLIAWAVLSFVVGMALWAGPEGKDDRHG